MTAGARSIEGEGDAELIKSRRLDERGSRGMERASLKQKKIIENGERENERGKVRSMYSKDPAEQGWAQTDPRLARGSARWARGRTTGFSRRYGLVASADES